MAKRKKKVPVVEKSLTKRMNLLTEELAKKIAKHVERGNRFYIACAMENILEDTGRHWLTIGRKWPNSPQGRFLQRIQIASAKAEERAQNRIQKGIKSSWVAAAWWLTHGPSKGAWAGKGSPTSIANPTAELAEQVRPSLNGMSNAILEASYTRLDDSVKIIEQQAGPDGEPNGNEN